MGIGSHTRACRGESNDWITPRYITEALGPFELDPCACIPQPWPCAKRSYTIEDDGLSKSWDGRVWLNPPYGPVTGAWLRRLAEHGNGVALVFARTETKMFVSEVWKKADALLFLWGRLYFYRPSGDKAQGNSGGPSVLIAYGKSNVHSLQTSKLPGSFVKIEAS